MSSESSSSTTTPPKKRSTRWLIWLGILCLLVPLAVTFWGMLDTYNSITARPVESDPVEVAHRIRVAIMAVSPLSILGIILVILGFVLRRRCSSAGG